MEKGRGLRVLKPGEDKFLAQLANAVRVGQPVLIEDVGETLDPQLDPLLQQQTFQNAGRTLIHLGDSDVDYQKDFRSRAHPKSLSG